MKVAFHFNADHPDLGAFYGKPILEAMLRAVLSADHPDIHSKVFCGDLLFGALAEVETPGTDPAVTTYRVDRQALTRLLEDWITVPCWRELHVSADRVIDSNVFVMCFESLRPAEASSLHKILLGREWYLGASEVDERFEIHWNLYSRFLVLQYRLMGRGINLFWDGQSDASKNILGQEWFLELGFSSAHHESTEGRRSIFDRYHDYDHARRVAEWKRQASDSLGFIAEHVVTRLSDPAPEIGNMLWAAFRAFEGAQTSEEYSQCMTSCRRILHYVADSLYPPTVESREGRKLGKEQFRNRLLAFVAEHREGDSNIDLVCTSTDALANQLEKLNNLASKGVHASVIREEARRCMVRTVLLLDDLLAFVPGTISHGGKD